ncbi:hypothetical protein RMSM_03102 [Rhodopirellula maiorica SM1]|uniref:Uncharacterized protein n=1 Tax=Rhodopirellula maiorica SM1 TaxID=1265738 RepID=M5RKW6_9BACT|nr:hypothetical protein RMSM_03102 [Rhodopirellula maiorica SM1]
MASHIKSGGVTWAAGLFGRIHFSGRLPRIRVDRSISKQHRIRNSNVQTI